MADSISTIQWAVLPKILLTTSIVRIVLIILMALSDAVIPDHNPGDDVLRFDLRLSSGCFCRQGLACDFDWKSHERSIESSPCLEASVSQDSFLWNLLLRPMTKWDAARFLTLAADPRQREPNLSNAKDPFLDSEQAHAFFPFFPILIRQVALVLIQTLPRTVLPPTFEAVLVVSAFLINTVSFALAAFFLVSLTLRLTTSCSDHRKSLAEKIRLAGTVATIFCCNPALIFFGTSYSESLFAMLTFGGYALYYTPYNFLALIPWMMASYTRSNGSMVSAWLLIQGIAQTIAGGRKVRGLVYHIFMALAVAIPIFLHDWAGYALHCAITAHAQPVWCNDDNFSSLYAYVQRKHWNVGFLRYYEWKQIPNFLLAAPILVSCTLGVKGWIQTSWREQPSGMTDGGPFPAQVFRWSLWALGRSQDASEKPSTTLYYAPSMLAHYAVLAAVALLGLTVAHVQISTRLICSTCPAIYWQLAHFEPRRLLMVYIAIYIVVGTILHVNFLPWT